MIELFQVKTVMPVLLGHKDVQIHWFITFRRRPVVPYGNPIADYNPSDKWARYAELCVDEFFTADEAHWLVGFLKAQDHVPEGTTYINKSRTADPDPIHRIGGNSNWRSARTTLCFAAAIVFNRSRATTICVTTSHFPTGSLISPGDGGAGNGFQLDLVTGRMVAPPTSKSSRCGSEVPVVCFADGEAFR